MTSAWIVRTGWPVAGSHNRTVPSASALASSLPSGLNATPFTPRPGRRCRPGGCATGWPVAGSHNRTVPSASALASSLPSGLNATPRTPPSGAGAGLDRALTGWPVAGSHNRTVPSASALASSLPSGLNATPYTPPLGPVSAWIVRDGLAGGRVPQPHRAVGVGAGQQLAVRAERHPDHAAAGAGVGLDGADGLAGGRIPQPHRAVAVGAGQQLAVRAERHPGHGAPLGPVSAWMVRTGWPVAGSHNRTVPSSSALASSLPSGLNATPATRAVWAGVGREGLRTGWPVAGSHNRTVPSPSALASSLPSGLNATPYTACAGLGVGLDGADGLAGGRVPQPHRAVDVGAGQQLAVRAERHPGRAALYGPALGRLSAWIVRTGWPVAESHNRTVPSASTLASSFPSRAERHPGHVHAAVESGVGLDSADGLAGGRVPQPHRAVAVGAGQQLAVRAERHPVHAGRVGGQDAVLLLLGQQGRHGRAGLVGGEDAPGSDGELPRGHGIGRVDVEAFGGELAGQGDGMLPGSVGGLLV